jgi:regulation of enolase protein 1 (concanavalin A-like superfamily)
MNLRAFRIIIATLLPLLLLIAVRPAEMKRYSFVYQTGSGGAGDIAPPAHNLKALYSRDCGAGQLLVDSTCRPVELALAPPPPARLFWVAQRHPAASDSNPGSQDLPWRTISRAAQLLQPGDVVIVRAGTYREAVVPARGGTDAAHRITYAAYPGEQVVISGADLLTQWTPAGNAWRHAWQVSLPADQARTDYERSQAQADGSYLRREMVIVDGQVLRAVGSREAVVPGTFYVEGASESPVAIYVRMPQDDAPFNHTVEAARRDLLFGVPNPYWACSTGSWVPGWIRVIGFTFRHSSRLAICSGSQGDLFEENVVEWNSRQGILIVGNNHTFRGNRISDNGRYGIGSYSSSGSLLEYNLSLRNNWKGFDPFWDAGGGKFVAANNLVIRGHVAGENFGVGIWFDTGNHNNTIEQSIIYGNQVAGLMLENNTTNTMVRNNVFYWNRIYGVGAGLLSQAASNNVIVNNSFIANEGSGLYIRYDARAPGGNNSIYNNLFSNNGWKSSAITTNDRGAEIYLGGSSLADIRSNPMDGNLYWHPNADPRSPIFYVAPGCQYQPGCHTETSDLQQWRALTGGDWSANIANPLLEDTWRIDGWRLTSNSPAIGMGVWSPVPVPVDAQGDARPPSGVDVGADQYTPAAGPPPAPWTFQDIGTVDFQGNTTYAGGIFTVSGAGADIWDTRDAFHYVYQQWTGDVQITARVLSAFNTDPWAKAGVMIRESLDESARHAMVVLTPSFGVSFQRRIATGGYSDHTTPGTGAAPCWVKLTRSGDIFSAYTSNDGVNWWLFGTERIAMSGTVYVGLAVTSHNNGAVSAAQLDNVSVSTGP